MMGGELAAAGITDPRLRQAYRLCRQLNAAHGRTFFLATRLPNRWLRLPRLRLGK